MGSKKIFIACPIKKYLTEDGIDKDFEAFIKNILNLCRQYSNKVFLALEREEYGKNKMYGEECTFADYEEIQDTDILIAFPEDSMGVSVEIGWASIMQKEVLLFVDKKYNQSELVKAINCITPGKRIDIDTSVNYNSQEDIILSELTDYLKENIILSELTDYLKENI